jgi:hypothetical protein
VVSCFEWWKHNGGHNNYRRPSRCGFFANSPNYPPSGADLLMMRSIRWRSWGGTTAVGQGVALPNMIGPQRARVTLSRPVHPCGGGQVYYTRAQFRYLSRRYRHYGPINFNDLSTEIC